MAAGPRVRFVVPRFTSPEVRVRIPFTSVVFASVMPELLFTVRLLKVNGVIVVPPSVWGVVPVKATVLPGAGLTSISAAATLFV